MRERERERERERLELFISLLLPNSFQSKFSKRNFVNVGQYPLCNVYLLFVLIRELYSILLWLHNSPSVKINVK